MAVGIRPSISVAAAAGLGTERGVTVNGFMQTSDPDIYAVGECVQFEEHCYGLVAPLYEQASICAKHLAGSETTTPFAHSQTATKLKVTGIDLYSAGDFAEDDNREEIVFRDAPRRVYKRLVLEDNKLVGAVLYGDTADGAWFFQKIKDGETISEDDQATLIFGPSYAGGGSLDPMVAVAALPDEAEICGCNGISKGRIVDAIDKEGLTDLAGVRACTKASSSCGTCTGLVESLLALTLGDEFEVTKKTVCGCTDLGHSDVRRLIVSQELKTIPAVMQELGWKTSCGCAKCRPALNYYLLATWPGEYVDDNQSRFINERVHANIQKDGTYSVVPRAFGGMTNASELRAIADVIDKFQIPTVKYTGGQRIDMLGVQKEDLPAVWADLNAAGLVSGHAYGKSLRTVKTCVGSEWCRFGTQDSTGLGIKLEKMMWGSWTPHKVKLAVSGCPRNCAEATCKDIGVVCVDSGYEIHFAGAAGMEVKATDLLCKVETEAAALEYCAALLQLYREQGHYLERIYKWTNRVGVEQIKQQIVADDSNRLALYERFLYAQSFSQDDPWEARASGGVDAHEFKQLVPAE